jgi:ribosomal protein S18 acetylase RimI-like enzyme
MDAAEIEALERSIVAAVAPPRTVEFEGWLAPLDDGSIGRAKSAVPLSHAADARWLDAIEAAYADAGLNAGFRVAESDGLAAVREDLMRRGYAPRTPTIMKTGTAAGMAALSGAPGEVLARPDAAWLATFSGEGFDPAESAQRLKNLTRSPGAVFGAVRDPDGRVAAVGVMSFDGRWAGVHGMRTAPDRRRQGLASRVLAALGREAQARGVGRVFLQVEEANPARILYRRAGFTQAWRYHYWRKDWPT